jgi:hypothetical protein
LLGVFPLVGERGRRRWRQSSGFLFEGAEEVIEVGGDIVGLEVQMKMLLDAGEWVIGGEGDDFVDCHASDRDQQGAVDSSGVHFTVELIEAVSGESRGAGTY